MPTRSRTVPRIFHPSSSYLDFSHYSLHCALGLLYLERVNLLGFRGHLLHGSFKYE
jgi:hypothetical protein